MVSHDNPQVIQEIELPSFLLQTESKIAFFNSSQSYDQSFFSDQSHNDANEELSDQSLAALEKQCTKTGPRKFIGAQAIYDKSINPSSRI